MFCPRCNNNVDNNAKYCTKCGNFLGNNINSGQNNFNNIPYQNINNNNYYNMNNNQNNNFDNNYHSINNQNRNLGNNYQNMNSQNRNVNMYNYYQNIHNKKKKNTMLISICSGTGLLLFVIVMCLFLNKGSYFFSTQNNQGSSSTDTTRGKYETSIVTDNIYDNVTINSVSDAKNLIVKDSVDQKGNCPSEIKKVEDDMIKKYNIIAVNLCEMDTDFAKELSSVFGVIFSEFPEAKKHLTNVTLYNGSTSDRGVIAAYYPIFHFANAKTQFPSVYKMQILLYANYFLNKDKLELDVKNSSSIGHFPPNATIYSPVAHELGHYLSFIAMMNSHNASSLLKIDNNTEYNKLVDITYDFSDGTFSKNLINTAYQRYIKDSNSSYTFDEFRGTISKYALAKNDDGEYIYDETIAEAFHDVYLNKDNAKPASKYIVQVLKEKLGG